MNVNQLHATIDARLDWLKELESKGRGSYVDCSWCHPSTICSTCDLHCPVSGRYNEKPICFEILYKTRRELNSALTSHRPEQIKIAARTHYKNLKKFTDRWKRKFPLESVQVKKGIIR